MKNCALVNTNLAFEYCSDIDASITTEITSVKNPISGKITALAIGETIFDDPKIDPSQTTITIGNQEANPK